MDDYKVRFRSDAEIARIAAEFRMSAGVDKLTRFSVAAIIRKLTVTPLKGKGVLKIVYLSKGPRIPYVKFEPGLQLFVHKETLDHSDLGDPAARFILAHELGHLVLHDHYAQRFSNDPSKRLKAFPKEESAEWQANRFAYHFLVPTKWVRHFADAQTIVETCEVTMMLATDRMLEVMAEKQISEFCFQCFGNNVQYGSGMYLCSDCGQQR